MSNFALAFGPAKADVTLLNYRALATLRREPGEVLWIHLHNPSETDIADLVTEFRIHPLAAEDAVHAQQRPKFEEYGAEEFLVIKTLHYVESSSQVETGDLMFYVGADLLISVQHGESSSVDMVRHRLEATPLATYAIVHAIMDHVVDTYMEIAVELEQDVSALEVKVFSNLRKTWSQDLYFLKREVIEFRRAVEPLRPLLARIASAETARVPDDVRPFFRDIDDHVNRAADTVSGLDQLIQAALDADIAQLQLRQNEDMRKITAWVALGAIPTLVAGIYGMNFTFIPGMHSEWGFAGVVGVLTVTCMSLYAKFKKSGWL